MSGINYFAYGAMEDPRVVSAVIGRKLKGKDGKNGILHGYELCVQTMKQVPDVKLLNAPVDVSPRQLLSESWLPSTFKSYTIRKNVVGQVRGKVWFLLDQLERDRIKDWELVEFGWFKEIQAQVLAGGQMIDIVTEGLGDGQSVDHVVDGLHYERLFFPIESILTVAEKARREFNARMHRQQS